MGAVSIWWRRWELPTWMVVATVYGGFGLVAGIGSSGPWVFPVLALLVAWHGSLQHETIHGHPTRLPWLNAVIGSVPLGVVLPYGIYRESHIAHHKTSSLTTPGVDPESFYVCPKRWDAMCQMRRALYRANATLVGRLILGPWFAWAALFRGEFKKFKAGDLRSLRHWSIHLALVAPLLFWLHRYAGIAIWEYFAFVVYPASSLTLLRSFAEHHPGRDGERTAVVEANPFLSLLFLHNNLHVLHHARPDLAWFDYPRHYRDETRHEEGYLRYSGYAEVLRRYAFKAQASPVSGGSRGE